MGQGNRWRIRAICAATALLPPQAAHAVGNDGPPSHYFESSAMLRAEDDLDLAAMRLMSNPAVLRARGQGEQELLATVPNPSPETRARFKQSAAEITFFGILNGLNDDPLHPRITVVGRPGRTVKGVDTLAPKGLDENPDSIYRIIPVDGTTTYVIHGKKMPTRPVVNEFSVLDDDWKTIANLSGDALKIDENGEFAITVGPGPAEGRVNYIQTSAGANYMTIRDTLGDWASEHPNILTVARVAGPPAGPALTADRRLAKVVAKVRRYFVESVKLHRRILAKPANVFVQPVVSSADGMLITQSYSIGRFELPKGQALVLTIHPGTAKYVTVPVTNLWGTTMDPTHHQSSLNSRQAARNPDGSFTVVVSPVDPKVENWVDTEGLPEGFLFLRWAAMESGAPAGAAPAVESRMVPLADIAGQPPMETQRLRGRSSRYDLRWAGK